MGISGYDGITYDPCIPFSDDYPESANSDNESWYSLLNVISGEEVMFHIDDDIQTIYYKIHDTNPDDLEADWGDSPTSFKSFIKFGINHWNAISIYKTNERGHLYPTRLANFVDVDTLTNGENITPNVNFYPVPGNMYSSVSGYCNPVESSIVSSDSQTYNGIEHIHYTQFNIYLVVGVLQANYDMLYSTVSHELGHVLGLGDIDLVEQDSFEHYHHQEVLMGYPNGVGGTQTNVTYRDLAGVMVARGLHTNSDHIWLYDEESSTEESHKLICTLCNCVKYVTSLNGYEYDTYGSCMDSCTYQEAHTLESGNMIPVARYNEKDYWKCKYCRYVCWFQYLSSQQYLFTGTYNENTHVLENVVEGLEYTVEETHDFSVDLGNNVYKCSSCPMCSNGSLYDGDITSYILECTMDNVNTVVGLEANQNMMYKLDVNCKNEYTIDLYADNRIILEVFDSDFRKITFPIISSNNKAHHKIENLFNPGIYYIRIRMEDYDTAGNYNLMIYSNDNCYNEPIDLNESMSILNHNHEGYSEFEYHNEEIGFYKITLNAISDSSVIYSEESLTIRNSLGNIIKKLSLYSLSPDAINGDNQNVLYVYFDTLDDYLLEINFNLTSIDDVTICIEKVDNLNIPVYNVFTSGSLDISNDGSSMLDFIYPLTIKQASQYQFDVSYDGDANSTETVLFFVIRKTINTNKTVTYSIVNQKVLAVNATYTIKLDLVDSDKYYIGYLGSGVEGNVDIEMNVYMDVHNGTIVTDPDKDTNCGTEVTMNSGSYRGNTITQGFSRICYFTNETISTSRLDYYWYVSDESVACVTGFGTILAKNVTSTKSIDVIAVYKYDMSYVVCTSFTILRDDIGYNVSYFYDVTISLDSTYQIPSDNEWPSPFRQHYEWISTDTSIATVTSWGNIVPVSVGTVNIYGEYIYNRRYNINITLIIE